MGQLVRRWHVTGLGPTEIPLECIASSDSPRAGNGLPNEVLNLSQELGKVDAAHQSLDISPTN